MRQSYQPHQGSLEYTDYIRWKLYSIDSSLGFESYVASYLIGTPLLTTFVNQWLASNEPISIRNILKIDYMSLNGFLIKVKYANGKIAVH